MEVELNKMNHKRAKERREKKVSLLTSLFQESEREREEEGKSVSLHRAVSCSLSIRCGCNDEIDTSLTHIGQKVDMNHISNPS